MSMEFSCFPSREAELRNTIEALKRLVLDGHKEREVLRSETTNLKQTINNVSAQRDEYAQQTAELTAQNAELFAARYASEVCNSELKIKIMELEHSISELKAENAKLHSETKQLTAENLSYVLMKGQLAEYTTELLNLRQLLLTLNFPCPGDEFPPRARPLVDGIRIVLMQGIEKYRLSQDLLAVQTAELTYLKNLTAMQQNSSSTVMHALEIQIRDLQERVNKAEQERNAMMVAAALLNGSVLDAAEVEGSRVGKEGQKSEEKALELYSGRKEEK